jgi:uncharacterized protein (TIGR02145 family)
LFNAGNINLRCESNIIETKCGNEWYDEKDDNYRCNGSIKQAKCGDDNWYRTADQRCGIGNVIETVCGEEWKVVVDNTWQCESDIWKTRCGSSYSYYDPNDANERCIDNVVEKACGAGWYNVANQRCENNVVETVCGSDWYNAADANLRCSDYIVETKCGANWYDAKNTNLKCQSNAVEAKCGTGWYKPYSHYCVDGIEATDKGEFTDDRNDEVYKYVTIGSQTWMAEDLKFATYDSECSPNDPSCAVSRLYNFETAQSVCPTGWHLPTDNEWYALIDFAGGIYSAGKNLKAKDSWGDDDSEDIYGFTALSTGTDIANDYWWGTGSYGYYFFGFSQGHYGILYGVHYSPTEEKFKVRCVQDGSP